MLEAVLAQTSFEDTEHGIHVGGEPERPDRTEPSLSPTSLEDTLHLDGTGDRAIGGSINLLPKRAPNEPLSRSVSCASQALTKPKAPERTDAAIV